MNNAATTTGGKPRVGPRNAQAARCLPRALGGESRALVSGYASAR